MPNLRLNLNLPAGPKSYCLCFSSKNLERKNDVAPSAVAGSPGLKRA